MLMPVSCRITVEVSAFVAVHDGSTDGIAFGGFARLLPDLKHLTAGLELANSITLDGESTLCSSCIIGSSD